MAGKRPVFFYYLQSFLNSRSSRNWVAHLLLALMTVCIVAISPVLAKAPAVKAIASLPSTQTPSLIQQGETLYDAGQFTEAVKVLQQALQIYQVRGDGLRQAMTLSNLSLSYQQLGLWTQATKAITDSLNLLQTGQNPGDARIQVLAQALDIKGRLQLALGQAEPALDTWQQAATSYAQAGDQPGVTRSRINQVQALRALGLYRQALTTLTELNKTLQTQPDSLTKAVGLRSLGDVLQSVGNLAQSRQILQQSLAIAQRLRSPQAVSAALLSLGNTARTQQDTKAALAFYQQVSVFSPPTTRIQAQLNQLSLLLETKQWSDAQALWPQIQSQITTLPPSRTAVYAQINFAQSLISLKQSSSGSTPSWLEIGQLLAKAVQQAKSIEDPRAEAYALGNLGGLYEQTQQWSSAKDITQQALILASAINAPDISYRWQWQLGRLLKAQGDIKGAIAAYTESVTTLKSLRNDLVAINPEIQFSFRDEVEPIYRQLVDLLLQSKTSQPSQPNLIQARTVIESLQLAELDNFFRVACLEGKPIQIDQVIDREDPQAAVIYPIILADRLAVILKLPNLPLRYYKTTIAQGKVERLLADLRLELTKPYTLRATQSLSKQVYDWLLQPAEADLAKSQVKTLVFVLDGSLRNVPMAALYDGQQYLVQKYALALTPGLQLLAPKSLQRRQIKALTAGLTESRQGFSALANVGRELEQIKSEVPTKLLLNQKFTSLTLQTEINSIPFPVVHLATHGQFSSQADQTFILAWDKPIFVNELHNLLQTRDTKTSNALELLVLSACQTAAGDKQAALGLAGVAVRAGARSTVASLWNLDDESTALLMSQFYRELVNNHLNKAEALRQAQLALLKNPLYELPMFWASYILVGNWL